MKIKVLKNFSADLGEGVKVYVPNGCEFGNCSNDIKNFIEIDDKFAIENNIVERIKKNGVAKILIYPKKEGKNENSN